MPLRLKKQVILLLGNSKSGKSALANLLTDSDDFNEGIKTEKLQKSNFYHQGKKYQVIDTVSFDNLTSEQILSQLEEIFQAIDNDEQVELNQVFFVNGRMI